MRRIVFTAACALVSGCASGDPPVEPTGKMSQAAHTTDVLHGVGCIEESYGKHVTCGDGTGAGDVAIASAVLAAGSPTECELNSLVTFTATFTVQTTSESERADVGFYFRTGATTGTAVSGTCSVGISSTHNTELPDLGSQNEDGDGCLGVGSKNDVRVTMEVVDARCVGDGMLDLNYCTTWKIPGTDGGNDCSSPLKAVPGAPSKCACGTLRIPITVVHRCGDGTLDTGEECDDGNSTNGDGCSATCTIDCEIPADDCPAPTTCNRPICVPTTGGGAICGTQPVGDGAACNDLFCAPAICQAGQCVPGTAPDCNDSVACTVDTCNETTNACVHTPNNALCNDGVFCNGVEICDPTGCTAGAPPSCDDSNVCTDDRCDATLDRCVSEVDPNNAATCREIGVLIIDEDSLENGSVCYWPSGTSPAPTSCSFFQKRDVNDNDAAIGYRAVLRYFANHVGQTITLATGQVGDEGWFAIPKSTTLDLSAFFAGTVPQSQLDKIDGVTPLRATGLEGLEGGTFCAVVYDSDVSINYGPLNANLQGETLGVVAFRVLADGVNKLDGFSSSTLPSVSIEILNPALHCGSLVGVDAPKPKSSSEPFDIDPENPTGGYL